MKRAGYDISAFKTGCACDNMRIGIPANSAVFLEGLNTINSKVQQAYMSKMTELVKPVTTKVMLGDMTVIDQTTFDITNVRRYFETIRRHLDDSWYVRDVDETSDEDLRRIFVKFSSEVSGYVISVHLSMQFHVLLYYRPDNRVAQVQKEVSEIAELLKDGEAATAEKGDQIIVRHLKKMGYTEPSHARLFQMLYEDDALAQRIAREIDEATDVGLADMSARRDKLLSELNSLLVETYHTSAALIDDSRLVTGEEGFLYTVDLERVGRDAGGNRTVEGALDAEAVPDVAQKSIRARLDDLRDAVLC